ncbi:MAG: hypothetical protein ACRDOK_20480 [Streptosporangiaceae bacterium]
MYEVKQAEIARAIDMLRTAPLTAAQFAMKMWPDRQRSHGSHSLAGHALLRRLGQLGYVEKVGDLWMPRGFGAGSAGQPASQATRLLADEQLGFLPGGPQAVSPDSSPPRQADRLRLQRLATLADTPVASVEHDVALGNVMIRGEPMTTCLADACAFVLLRGRSANVYLPCGAQMLVGLTPVEAARVLYLRWQQSGAPPDLPHEDAWIVIDDGIIACPNAWRPASADESWIEPEELGRRVQRQRVAAGLA